MRNASLPILLAALALAATGCSVQNGNTLRQDVASPDLDVFRGLVGDWVALDENGQPTDEVVSRYSLTAGGSAVLEKLFEGTEKEMTTLYHQDGDALVLTHYCMMGNQPRMQVLESESANEYEFHCIGGSNMESEDDAHMHHGHLQLLGEDRLHTQWTLFEKGEPTHEAGFDLARVR